MPSSWRGKQARALGVCVDHVFHFFASRYFDLADPGVTALLRAGQFLERGTDVGEHTQGRQQTPGQPLHPRRTTDGGCWRRPVPDLLALPCLLVQSTYSLWTVGHWA